MSLFHVLLWLHIIGAVVWIGAALTMEGLAWRIRRTGTVKQLRDLFSISEWLSKRYYMPASLLTLLAGIGLVLTNSRFAFSQAWIIIGIGGFMLSSLMGGALIGPTTRNIERLLEHHDLRNPTVITQLGRLTILSRLDITLLLIILLDMTAKPSWDSIYFWTVAAIGIILALIIGDRTNKATAR